MLEVFWRLKRWVSDLNSALEFAKKYENFVIIKEKIEGREFSVGILNGEALPVIEIKPLIGFYDYKHKYQKGLTEEICPANISDEIRNLLQNSAIKVHKFYRRCLRILTCFRERINAII